MTDLDATIAQLKKDIESARIKKIRSEADRDRAERDKLDAVGKLKEQFGLDNLTDARDKLADLRSLLADSIKRIEEDLQKF